MTEDYRTYLRRRLVECDVPEHLHKGLIEYVAARRPVGSFLTACLSNDLLDAAVRADDVSRPRLYTIAFFLLNYVTLQSWGSRQRVAAWLEDPEPAPEVFE